jgi:ATP-dependent exoDNAse (exonuclease V) beta subunit
VRLERRLRPPVDLPGGAVIQLTAEQREAVARRDGPLFVRAAAGSGKTRVLVERFVAAVRDDGVPVDRVLAITFTEKAAAELKSRVRARLLGEGEREAARAAEAAAISTIHGFCARVLRSNALAAGLDPDFHVLDETESARLAFDAFDAALEAFLEAEVATAEAAAGDPLDLAASYGPDRLRAMVVTVHGKLRSQGREPRLPPAEPPAPAGERERLEAAAGAAAAELGGAAGANRTVDRALAALDRCGDFLRSRSGGDLPDPADLKDLEVKRGNVKAMQTPAFDELADAYRAYVTLCTTAQAAKHHALLARLLELFAERYAALKDERSALDFDDLELLARDLLRDDGALRREVAGRFEQVMVDEFQDTNPLQVELIDLVADGNLFAVGDERQSIYGFRHAEVELFRRRGTAAAEAGRAASLRTNFRTRPELVAALDATFAAVWGEDFEPLVPAPGGAGPPAADPPVELLVVDGRKQRWDDALGGETAARDAFGAGVGEACWRAVEARLLADRIAALAGPGGPFGYGDVAILLRAATDMALYERALVERGIPAYSHGGRGFSEAQQVSDLRAYLAALANPLDELAMTTLLASPLVGASLDALALARFRCRRTGRDLWWALRTDEELSAALPARDRERLAAFTERFARQREAAPRISLEDLIDRAVTESGYDRVVLAMPGGERRLANVRKLMRLARRFEADRGRDLRRFIDHLDERELLRAHEGEAPVEGQARTPAVRLMTIHAAKGLEFPVVCVADLGRPVRGGEDEGLRVADDGRVGLRLASLSGERSDALEWERLKEEQTERAEQEERRILYVAMTRAQEHLVLSGATDSERWPEHRPLERPLDWLWRALAPGARSLLETTPTGVDVEETEFGQVRVGCVLCTPGTVDEVLPAAARNPAREATGAAPVAPPGEAAPAGAAAAAWEPPPRPAFPAVGRARALPVGRLSYSSLESYRRCGYRFYLERVAGMRPRDQRGRPGPPATGDGQLVLAVDEAPPPAAPEEGISPMLRGSIVHELLERLDMRAPALPAADEIAARLRGHGAPDDDPDEIARIGAFVEGFAGSELRERLAAAEEVRTELSFAFELSAAEAPSVLVNGFMDVHAVEPGGDVLVVDYKTDPLVGEDPAALVERGYTTQRLVYALAALRAGTPRVEVAYSFLEAPERPVAEVYEDAAELERRLLELAAGVLGGRYEPTATPHRELCWTCPGRPALCSWGPEMTLRDPPATPPSGRPIAGVRS